METIGSGAMAVPTGDTEGFAHAPGRFLTGDDLCREMVQSAWQITAPFAMEDVMTRLVPAINFNPGD